MYAAGKKTKAAAMNELTKDMPYGARGYIEGAWETGGGAHIFNWEKRDGKVHYWEGQVPGSDDVTHYLREMKFPTMGMVRTDTLVPTKELLERSVQARTPELEKDLKGKQGGGAAAIAGERKAQVLKLVDQRKAQLEGDAQRFRAEADALIAANPDVPMTYSNPHPTAKKVQQLLTHARYAEAQAKGLAARKIDLDRQMGVPAPKTRGLFG